MSAVAHWPQTFVSAGLGAWQRNADRSEAVLPPGERTDLYLIPRQAGRYRFACADHDRAGMTGEIIVESGG